jgi:hypothetical protein
MNIFLRLGEAVLFVVFLLPILAMAIIPLEQENASLLMMFLSIANAIVVFGWYYSLGTTFYGKIREKSAFNLRLFRLCILYVLGTMLTIPFLYYFRDDLNGNANVGAIFVIIFLATGFAIMYCMRFVARSIVTYERKELVGFADYAGPFFLLWFYPLGVWFIQPKVHKLLHTQ